MNIDKCIECGQRIHPTLRRYLIRDRYTACASCMHNSSNSRLHSRVAPDCPVRWHDVWDHSDSFVYGPRDAVAHVLEATS